MNPAVQQNSQPGRTSTPYSHGGGLGDNDGLRIEAETELDSLSHAQVHALVESGDMVELTTQVRLPANGHRMRAVEARYQALNTGVDFNQVRVALADLKFGMWQCDDEAMLCGEDVIEAVYEYLLCAQEQLRSELDATLSFFLRAFKAV